MKKNRILVVALQGLGNLVMTLPAVEILGANAGGAEVHVLVPHSSFRSLLAGNPHVSGIIEAQGVGLLRLIKHLRDLKFDTVVLSFPSGPRSNLLAAVCGAGTRVAFSVGRSRFTSFLLTKTLMHDDGMHDVDANRLLALTTREALGLSATSASSGPWIHISSMEQEQAVVWLGERRIVAGETIVGLAPGSGHNQPFKRWPLPHFMAVCDRLQQQLGGLKFLWFTGPDEVELATDIAKLGFAEEHVLVNNATLRETLSLLNQCDVVVSNDNGLMHMAGALGRKTVAVFGPTDEARNGPARDDSIVVASNLKCRPCYSFNALEFDCSNEVKYACLDDGLVENVVISVRDVLAGGVVTD